MLEGNIIFTMRATRLRWVALAAAFFVVGCSSIIAFEPSRSVVARALIAAYLTTKGLHLSSADLHVTSQRLSVRNLAIDERDGRPVLSAASFGVAYTIGGAHLAVTGIELDDVVLFVRKAQDGSFDLAHMFAGNGAAGSGASGGSGSALAMHGNLRLSNGSIYFENQYSPARLGRTFALRELNVRARLDTGAMSVGRFSGVVVTPQGESRVSGDFSEDDAVRLAQMHANARHAEIASVLNYFISNPDFVAEDGITDVAVHGYAIGWSSGSSPSWTIAAKGTFYDTRLRLVPLIVPVRNVHGPFSYVGDVLALPHFSGEAAGLRVAGHGTISLQPSPWLNLTVASHGPLANARKLLAFTKPLAVHGSLDVGARVVGSPSDPQIGIAFAMPGGWHLAQTPIGVTNGALVYHGGHATLPFVVSHYEGISVHASGDVVVGEASPPSGQLIALAAGPANAIPWVANVDRAGVVTGRLAFSGPIEQPNIDGFLELQGRRTVVRGAFSSDPATLSIGPLLATDSRGGYLLVRATMLQSPGHLTAASLIADHFSLDLNDRRTALPGIISQPVGTSRLSASMNGTAAAAGQRDRFVLFKLGMDVGHMTVGTTQYGDASISSSGAIVPKPAARILAQLQIRRNSDMGGLPVRSANAVVGATSKRLRIYAATAQVAGGMLGLSGDVQAGHPLPSHLLVAANHIQLGQMGLSGLPSRSGEVTALGWSAGSQAHPKLDVSATAREVALAGTTVSGDAELSYNGSSLGTHDSRVLIDDGSAIEVTGSVDGLGQSAPLAAAGLHLNAQIRNGDIAQLVAMAPQRLPLTGALNASLHIGGDLSSPSVRGQIASDAGTFRGVGYRDLHATVAGAPGSIAVDNAGATIGSSQLQLSAHLSKGEQSASVESPHVDLADFNDFFGGKDVLAGTGSGDVTLRLDPSRSFGSGSLQFTDVAIDHVPFGSVRAQLSMPERSKVTLAMQNQGAAGTGNIVATLGYPPGESFAAPSTARYDVSADVRDIDLSRLAVVMPQAAEGLRGRLALRANAWGTAGQLHGTAGFDLADGYIGKDRINALSGSVAADDRGISVQNFHGNVAGVDLTARGLYTKDRQLSAHARVATADVTQLERLAGQPDYVQGPAQLDLDASGSATQPRVRAQLEASQGTAFGVAYDRVAGDMTYASGALVVNNAQLDLASKRGSLTLRGTLPASMQRQAPGARTSPTLRMQLAANDVQLAAFDPLLAGNGSLEGQLNAQASATGSLLHPLLQGSARLRGGVVRSKLETVPLTRLNADVAFTGDTVRLQNLQGTLGKGTVAASGKAEFEPAFNGSLGRAVYDVHLQTRAANISVPQFFSGVVDANFGINTFGLTPHVNSDVIISNANIPLAGILALASGSSSGEPAQAAVIPGVPPYRTGHTTVYGGQIFGDDQVHVVQPTPRPVARKHLTEPLALNIDASAGDNVQVTGLVNATGAGTVHVGGSLAAPQMSGDLTVIRGDASLFDTVFHILRGDVHFHPSDGLMPTLDAEAIAFRPEADVTVKVYGRVNQLHTEFDSDPPMSQQDILANILHINDINAALGGGGSGSGPGVQPVGLAATALTGHLLSAVNYGLERTLHIEEVDLAFDQNGQASLELRKQYGKNLYAIFRSSLGTPPQQEVGMMYTPRNGLQVEWLEKQNTAGQTYTQQGQYQTWQVIYSIPNPPHAHHKHEPPGSQGNPVNLGF